MRRCLFIIFLSIWSLAYASAEPNGTLPQPKLSTVSLTITNKKLIAEVADEESEREKGMMFRKSMESGEAMLFVFDAPRQMGFWMKNTIIPLSIAYLNSMGMIMEIYDLKPRDETPVNSHFDTITYAIEVPQDWFTKNGIVPGTLVKGLPPLSKE